MFVHGKTGKKFYSIRDKIKFYNKRAYNDKTVTPAQKEHALRRIKELKALASRSYDEPVLVVTNDKHFGNKLEKPRLAAVVDRDDKGRLLLIGVHDRTTNAVILDNDMERQFSGKKAWIDREDVYETEHITGVQPLTENDKRRVLYIFRKK